MVEADQVDPTKLTDLFRQIEPKLYRFPSVDPPSLRAAVQSLAAGSALYKLTIGAD